MAFYNPPGAPQRGGLTVDSSRYLGQTAQPIANPFDTAYAIKQQAMNMKRLERKEKQEISAEELSKLQNDIFELSDADGSWDPSSILEGGEFNTSELQKRRFTSNLKKSTWDRYKQRAELAGGVADRIGFEQTWNTAKAKEDDKILSEMWSDVQQNRMDEKDFNLAVRNPQFRDYWKDVSVEQKQGFQAQMEQAGIGTYQPGYRTGWEKTKEFFGQGEDDTFIDTVTSPGGMGTGVAIGTAAGYQASKPLIDFMKGTQQSAYDDALKNVEDLKEEAAKLGKRIKGQGSVGVQFKKFKDKYKGIVKELDSGEHKNKDLVKQYKDYKNELRDLKKQKVTLDSDLKEAEKAKRKSSKALKEAKGKYGKKADWIKKNIGKEQFLKTPGALATGLRGFGAGSLAAMPTRMLLGDDTKGKKLTNEAIELIGTQAGMGSGQVALLKQIKNKIKDKGMGWALRRIASKGGLKLATSVGTKALLGTAGGILSGGALLGVSGALLATDLWDIANILAE